MSPSRTRFRIRSIWPTLASVAGALILLSCGSDDGGAERPGHFVRVAPDGTSERLTAAPAPIRNADVSRDGRYQVVQERSRKTGWDLFVLDLETGSREAFLASASDEIDGALAPHGRWMAYSSDATGRHEIYIRPFPARRGVWQISFVGGRSPLWAADGTEVYYRADDGNVRAVRVDPSELSVRIGSDRVLFEDRFVRSEASWNLLPDGSFLMLEQD